MIEIVEDSHQVSLKKKCLSLRCFDLRVQSFCKDAKVRFGLEQAFLITKVFEEACIPFPKTSKFIYKDSKVYKKYMFELYHSVSEAFEMWKVQGPVYWSEFWAVGILNMAKIYWNVIYMVMVGKSLPPCWLSGLRQKIPV